MKNFIDDPGYEPVNPYRFDFNIPILRYIQVNTKGVRSLWITLDAHGVILNHFCNIFIVFYLFLHDTSYSNNFAIWSLDGYLYSMLYNDFGSSSNFWNKWHGRMEGIHAMVHYKSLGLLTLSESERKLDGLNSWKCMVWARKSYEPNLDFPVSGPFSLIQDSPVSQDRNTFTSSDRSL